MEPFTARVRNGRLVLDEPTQLPEGEVVHLTPVPAALHHGERHDNGGVVEPTLEQLARLIDEQELLAELQSLG